MISAKQIAHYFISKSQRENDPRFAITPLKIQKLVYYSQAWYTTLNNKRVLFEEKIKAWVHGPVIPSLYGEFREYGYSQIVDFDPNLVNEIPQGYIALLDMVWDIYGKYSAKELEKLTHTEDPWLNARNNLPLFMASDEEITVEDMYNYYSRFTNN